MKKITFICLILMTIIKLQAQNYLIDFLASGVSTTLDSVRVENLSQSTYIMINGNDTLNLVNTVGINNNNANIGNCIIYPNPMNEYCTVSFTTTEQSNTFIGIFDIAGKCILQTQNFVQKGRHNFRINGLSTGIYNIIIKSDKFYYSKTLINNANMSGNVEIYKQSSNFNTETNTNYSENSKGNKDGKSIITMLYNQGEQIQFTGYSGSYIDVITIIPTQTQTITFHYVACNIGDSLGGGIVFYVGGGDCYISSTSDQESSGAGWGCYGTYINNANGTQIGTGKQNTKNIDSICTTTGIAADICKNLSLNGYSDWFLPSKDELYQMYLHKTDIGGFQPPDFYWSSSQSTSTEAWCIDFSFGGAAGFGGKNDPYSVRCIRILH